MRYWKKCEYNGTVHRLFIDLEKAYDGMKREILYNIFIEFGAGTKIYRLIKICLTEPTAKYSYVSA